MLISGGDILKELGRFFSSLFEDFGSGMLFFGGPFDITIAILDILATTLVVYYVLRILRDSRAWQLLKGLFLILAFAVICSIAGLNTVGYLLNNTISVFAIALVVIFQPELRRALETVGRSSFSMISSAITTEEKTTSTGSIHKLIESIVRACEKMVETRTGALMIIERQTKLGELFDQENVVHMDAAVSATMLLQVFYKGSPLHDGAVLIRDGRLAAARVHVPLSDNYHLRRDYGTRHRAAIGASELGDAIAIVVSEERGVISLSLEGRLYSLENGDALRSLLHKLLAPQKQTNGIGGLLRGQRRSRRSKTLPVPDTNTKDFTPLTAHAINRTDTRDFSDPTPAPVARKSRVLLLVISLLVSIGLWLYVQVTINPIDTRTYIVALSSQGAEALYDKGLGVQVPVINVQVTMIGRRRTITELQANQIRAYLDFTKIEKAAQERLTVQIRSDLLSTVRTARVEPESILVSIYPRPLPEPSPPPSVEPSPSSSAEPTFHDGAAPGATQPTSLDGAAPGATTPTTAAARSS